MQPLSIIGWILVGGGTLLFLATLVVLRRGKLEAVTDYWLPAGSGSKDKDDDKKYIRTWLFTGSAGAVVTGLTIIGSTLQHGTEGGDNGTPIPSKPPAPIAPIGPGSTPDTSAADSTIQTGIAGASTDTVLVDTNDSRARGSVAYIDVFGRPITLTDSLLLLVGRSTSVVGPVDPNWNATRIIGSDATSPRSEDPVVQTSENEMVDPDPPVRTRPLEPPRPEVTPDKLPLTASKIQTLTNWNPSDGSSQPCSPSATIFQTPHQHAPYRCIPWQTRPMSLSRPTAEGWREVEFGDPHNLRGFIHNRYLTDIGVPRG